MREQYHEQLAEISERLIEMTQMVGDAMGRSTRALLETDLQAAESVIASDIDIDERAQPLALRQQLARERFADRSRAPHDDAIAIAQQCASQVARLAATERGRVVARTAA